MGNSIDNPKSIISHEDELNLKIITNKYINEGENKIEVTLFENAEINNNNNIDNSIKRSNILMYIKDINKNDIETLDIKNKITKGSLYKYIFKKIKDNFDEQEKLNDNDNDNNNNSNKKKFNSKFKNLNNNNINSQANAKDYAYDQAQGIYIIN
jgi:hypothetical protein